MSRRRRRRAGAILGGLAAALLVPALALAHPLGNFTINHYAGIRVEPDRILLDIVVDQAEIPAFQARLAFDTDADGELSDDEVEAGRVAACEDLGRTLSLAVDGTPRPVTLTEAGLTFPPGVGGLSTMRTVCGFSAALAAPLAAGARIAFADGSFADRIGWREIVASGSGVALSAFDGTLRPASISGRLTAYPTNLLTQALADVRIGVTAAPGGSTLPPFDIPDAWPLPGAGDVASAGASPGPTISASTVAAAPAGGAIAAVSAGGATAETTAGAVPGGVSSGDLPSIFRTTDVTPLVLLASLLTAAALGAGHALTPGHGKTLMAAYLVGTRGTPLHAAGLGLSVTLSHTIGILVLAALVVGAGGILPPDLVVKTAPVVAAVSILVIGGWMLAGEARRRRQAGAAERGHRHAHAHGLDHEHPQEHDLPHEDAAPAHDVAHEDAAHALDHGIGHDPDAREHSHGGIRHSHLPPVGTTISWRSLFVLGLAGGLIPSTSALLILLGSIAAGRPAFGFVLVVAFGLGMALVMGGIGLALVLARGRVDRFDASSPLGRVSGYIPLLASCLVVGLGLYLTFQAVAGNTTF